MPSTSLSLTQASWKVLRTDKKLLFFPLLCTICVFAIWVSPYFIGPWLDLYFFPWVSILGLLVCSGFLTVFFTVALIRCTLVRFHGGTPTPGDGLKTALRRLPQILAFFAWPALFGLIGMIPMVGRQIKWEWLLGPILALGMAVPILLSKLEPVFILPVLAVEGLGLIQALKRSAVLLGKLRVQAFHEPGDELLRVLLTIIPSFLMFAGGAALGGQADVLVFKIICVLGVLLGLFYFVLMFVIGIALAGISGAALYHYAVLGEMPSGFDATAIEPYTPATNSEPVCENSPPSQSGQ